MTMRASLRLLGGTGLFLVIGCSPGVTGDIFSSGGSGGGNGSGASTATSNPTMPDGPSSAAQFMSGGTTTGGGNTCNSPPDMDMDGDGWTGAQGDCNDCDPN